MSDVAQFYGLSDADQAAALMSLAQNAAELYWQAGRFAAALHTHAGAMSLPADFTWHAWAEALLPLFVFLRGTTYLGWIVSRPEIDTAKSMGPMLVERACTAAERYLQSR